MTCVDSIVHSSYFAGDGCVSEWEGGQGVSVLWGKEVGIGTSAPVTSLLDLRWTDLKLELHACGTFYCSLPNLFFFF